MSASVGGGVGWQKTRLETLGSAIDKDALKEDKVAVEIRTLPYFDIELISLGGCHQAQTGGQRLAKHFGCIDAGRGDKFP